MGAGLQVVAGLGIITVALLDVAWTTVAAGSGAGPLTGRIARRSWQLALAVHRRRPSHRFLAVAGVSVVFVVLAAWITLVLAGWSVVFTAADGAVRATATGQPAGLVDRVYFVGYTVFTLGVGDMRPGKGTWQLLTVLATSSGLMLVTLAITYLVPVASAATQRRHLAVHVSSLGRSPAEILTRAWNGDGFGMLSQHLVTLTGLLHASAEGHHTYPVLHYFHSVNERAAAAPAITNLALALDLLHHGVAPEARLEPSVVRPLDEAMDLFLTTVASSYVTASDDPIPPPDLSPLEEAGIPTADVARYQDGAAVTTDRRRILAALLEDDGR